jgi:hypothetical protein
MEKGKEEKRRRKLVVLVFRLWFCVTELLQQLEGVFFLLFFVFVFFFFIFSSPFLLPSTSPHLH